MMQIRVLLVITAVIAMPGLVMSQGVQATPVGLWRSIDDKTGQAKAEVRIKSNAAGVLTGVVEKGLMPGQAPICTACTDDRKDKPKLGMEIIRGAQKSDGKDVWEGGRILEPETGRTYALRMSPADGGNKLELRVSVGPFGRTQIWQRIN